MKNRLNETFFNETQIETHPAKVKCKGITMKTLSHGSMNVKDKSIKSKTAEGHFYKLQMESGHDKCSE
jgi:hypothetical protein